MAVQLILATDTLETGFRSKANASFKAIVVSATPVMVSGQYSGVIRLNCFDGSFINLDLTTLYYTQTQITQLLEGFTSSLYVGDWSNAYSGGYGVKSVVSYNGNFWRSNISGNADVPGATANWTSLIGASSVPFTLVGGTTVNPFIINLSSYPLFDKNASFIYKVGTDPNYTRFEDYTISETATGFSIFLHDNGSGKVAEDGVLIMKQ